MSLASPNRLLTAAANKSYEVAFIRLSSQYPCGSLTRHWSKQNPLGLCQQPLCFSQGLVETPEHILIVCPAYTTARKAMFLRCISHENSQTQAICVDILLSRSTYHILQLLLDSSSIPMVVSAGQIHGEIIHSNLFYLGRTWCFSLHRERQKFLGKWNFR